LESDNTQKICWYADAAFAAHKDLRSHTGAFMNMGSGEVFHFPPNRK